MLALVASLALAADEPCYGHTFDQRISTAQFWVEWDGDVIDEAKAQVIADAAEDAAAVYRELGWPVTTEPVVIAVQAQGTFGIAGLTRTDGCDTVPVPRVDLFVGRYDETSAKSVTAHEIGHVAEYAYMGAYDDSVDSWLWWMEGTATWLTPHADGSWTGWGAEANPYLQHPGMALHHGLEGFLDDAVSDHMYATTWVAETLTEYAGEDAVRATWEWGADHTGTPIFFPDAVNGAGIDFDAYWAWHLAALPTLAVERGAYVVDPEVAQVADALPASGDSTGPEGLGIEIVQFPSNLGAKKSALYVTFDGDPAVDWHVVVARTNGADIVDYAPIEVVDGHGEGWIPGFYRVDGWLVASPSTFDANDQGIPVATPHAFSWSAELGDDADAMPGTVTLSEAPESGGCDHTRAGGLLGALAAGVLARRRR